MLHWGWMWCLAAVVAGGCVAVLIGTLIVVFSLRWHLDKLRSGSKMRRNQLIGFFHPHSTGGGGGERVLWTMLNGLMALWPDADFVVYTYWSGQQAPTHDEIQPLVLQKFGIALARQVEVVQLNGIKWVESSSYPRLTLLLQSLGAIPLAWEALQKVQPDVFIDTSGHALAYPLARLCGRCKVGCYVHYPIVSSDMLSMVRGRQESYNNKGLVAKSRLLTHAKLVYYRTFAHIYGIAGRHSHAIMVNSSWTKGHIMEVWKLPSSTVERVFPPCDVGKLLPLGCSGKSKFITSVAQFRPEKNHELQLQSFKLLANKCSDKELQLHLVGGVRNDEDRQRVAHLQKRVVDLDLGSTVVFHVDLDYAGLLKLLDRSMIGLHTMWCEHFGIGVVEYMAAGCIPVAHNSGGPKMDIVLEGCGYLAETAKEYASAMEAVLNLPASELATMQKRAKEASQRFSEEAFITGVKTACSKLNCKG